MESPSVIPPTPSIVRFSGVPVFINAGSAFAKGGLRSVSIAPVSRVKSRCFPSTRTSMTGLEL